MAALYTVRFPAFAALMCALAFTLSALPGFSSEAEVSALSLSSSCNLGEKLSPVNGDQSKPQTCTVPVTAKNGDKGEVTIEATLTTETPKHKLGQPVPAQPVAAKQVVKIKVKGKAACSDCKLGMIETEEHEAEPIQESQFENLDKLVEAIAKQEGAVLLNAKRAEADQMKRENRCEIRMNAAGQYEDVPERQRVSCLVDRMEDMSPDEREAAYDEIRDDLQRAIKDPSKRTQAKQILERIERMSGNSSYLKESTSLMKDFASLHDAADMILANPNDPNRSANVTAWNAAAQKFRAAGMQVGQNTAAAMNELQLQNYKSDLEAYNNDLAEVANRHRSLLGGLGNTNAIGSGRTQYSARPVGSVSGPASNMPIRPPVVGSRVNPNGAPMSAQPIRR